MPNYSSGVISIPNVTGNIVITAVATAATVTSISAVFNQGQNVIYDTDSLDTLKQYLTVTSTYTCGATAVVTGYTLSGTLTAGTSTITVSYSGKTTTYNVTVTSTILYQVTNYAVDKSTPCIDTEIALLNTDRDFTILFDGTQSTAVPTGYSQRIFNCTSEASNWKGVFAGGGNNNNAYNIQWYSGSSLNIGANRTSTNARIRIAYRHTAGTDQALLSQKVNDSSRTNLTASSPFISNGSATLMIGGADPEGTTYNWAGTITRCIVYGVVLSDDDINDFFE